MQDILTSIANKIVANHDIGHAPVDLWTPDYCGALDIEIKADGHWYYQNSPIKRQKLVELFASILWRDVKGDGATYLVTPVEKIKIKVSDAAFIATDMQVGFNGKTQYIGFDTNYAGHIIIGENHPIRFCHDNDQFMAYISVRYGLEAKLSRALCFQLADNIVKKNGQMVISSNGVDFLV